MALLPTGISSDFSPEKCFYNTQNARLHVQQAIQDNNQSEALKALQEMEDAAELLYRHIQKLESDLQKAPT